MDDTQISPTLTPQIPTKKSSPLVLGIVAVVIVLAGGIVGYFLAPKPSSEATVAGSSTTPAMVKTETEAGSTDTKLFRDSATGKIESGGINGEGTHKLIRTGGSSQTVYLTSSVLDLEEYVGKQVEVRGETNKGSKASWLMDVGWVKIVQ